MNSSCPYCRQELQIDASMSGQRMACPLCFQHIQIPFFPVGTPLISVLPVGTPLASVPNVPFKFDGENANTTNAKPVTNPPAVLSGCLIVGFIMIAMCCGFPFLMMINKHPTIVHEPLDPPHLEPSDAEYIDRIRRAQAEWGEMKMKAIREGKEVEPYKDFYERKYGY